MAGGQVICESDVGIEGRQTNRKNVRARLAPFASSDGGSAPDKRAATVVSSTRKTYFVRFTSTANLLAQVLLLRTKSPNVAREHGEKRLIDKECGAVGLVQARLDAVEPGCVESVLDCWGPGIAAWVSRPKAPIKII